MSASDPPSESTARPARSPLEGGSWRPLTPDDLLRRSPSRDDQPKVSPAPQPPLERRQQLEHIIKDRPADMSLYLELAGIYRQLGRNVEATRVLQVAHEVEPADIQVRWELEEATLARALQQLQDVRDVAQRLQTSEADRELQRAEIAWARCRANVCHGRLERQPDAHHLRVVLGEALHDLGEHEEALEALRPALEDDQESPTAYWWCGQCYRILGHPREALRAFRHAALRRAVPAPQPLRVAALTAALETAEHLKLTASAELYRQALQQAQQEAPTPPTNAPPNQEPPS